MIREPHMIAVGQRYIIDKRLRVEHAPKLATVQVTALTTDMIYYRDNTLRQPLTSATRTWFETRMRWADEVLQ